MKLRADILHEKVPPDWYVRGIKENPGQRFWHYRRFRNVGKLITPVEGRVLDVGSADGSFTKVILSRSGARLVVGVDALPSSVAYAKKRFEKNKKLRFRVADALSLPFNDDEFEAAFALEILEHVFAPKQVLAQIKRVLKKDGYAIFLVPTENFLFKIIWFFWVNSRGRIWKGTHVQQYDHKKLENLIKRSGFKIIVSKTFLLGMLKVIKAQPVK